MEPLRCLFAGEEPSKGGTAAAFAATRAKAAGKLATVNVAVRKFAK
jgi:hypothetical protein